MNDVTIYSFEQLSNAEHVIGATLKIALDAENQVTAVFACIEPEPDEEKKLLSRQEAESLAAAHCEENGLNAEILTEYTDRVLILFFL